MYSSNNNPSVHFNTLRQREGPVHKGSNKNKKLINLLSEAKHQRVLN